MSMSSDDKCVSYHIYINGMSPDDFMQQSVVCAKSIDLEFHVTIDADESDNVISKLRVFIQSTFFNNVCRATYFKINDIQEVMNKIKCNVFIMFDNIFISNTYIENTFKDLWRGKHLIENIKITNVENKYKSAIKRDISTLSASGDLLYNFINTRQIVHQLLTAPLL